MEPMVFFEMRLPLLVLVTAVSLTATRARASAASAPDVEVMEHRLENGMLLILAPRPSGGVAFARMFHGEGSVHDPPGLAGMAHLFEHLLFEGTARLGTWKSPESGLPKRTRAESGSTRWGAFSRDGERRLRISAAQSQSLPSDSSLASRHPGCSVRPLFDRAHRRSVRSQRCLGDMVFMDLLSTH